MPWEKPTLEMIKTFDKVLPNDSRIEKKKMFGCPVGFVNGNMFAGLHENKVVLRLAERDLELFRKEYRAKPFEPIRGRVMRDWIVVPSKVSDDKRLLSKWTSEAFTHTATLPAKAKKTKKVKTKSIESK